LKTLRKVVNIIYRGYVTVAVLELIIDPYLLLNLTDVGRFVSHSIRSLFIGKSCVLKKANTGTERLYNNGE
jgi:hypothetical protein